MVAKLFFISLLSGLSFAYLPSTEGGRQNELPEAIEGVGIDENLNQPLPGSLEFLNDRGQKVKIADFYTSKKPIILSMVYYSCPSLCNLHLKGVFEVFKGLGLEPGKDYEFLAVTIDPKEGPDVAAAKKENYVTQFLGPEFIDTKGIHFLSGSQENINKLADLVGFHFKWDQEAQEWAHASAAIISTPQGLISRYLHGVYFDPQTFRYSLVEASKGRIGSLADNFALFCFRYDPKANKYSFYIMKILKVVAGIVLFGLLLWLVPFWAKSMRTKS